MTDLTVSPSQDFRRRALQKIAALSTASAAKYTGQSDIIRLCEACSSKKQNSLKTRVSEGPNGVCDESTVLSETPMVMWPWWHVKQ